MLQQTQVQTVIPYYRRFLKRFPSVRALAQATEADVLKLWEGLGYYRRAQNLHRAARDIVRHGGRFPTCAAEWQRLPGIGPYTAAAISSVCFGEPRPAVDGNVRRVIRRLTDPPLGGRDGPSDRRIAAILQEAIPHTCPGDFNEAMMELGALLCRPRAPACGECPVQRWCAAFRRGSVDHLPPHRRRSRVRRLTVVAAILVRNGRVLITRRRPNETLAGLWEFPGGKKERGETLKEALQRELREETGLHVRVGRRLCVVRHAYTHRRITLHVFLCRPLAGRARPLENAGVQWVRWEDLGRYAFSAADRRVMEQVASTVTAASRRGEAFGPP